MRPGEIMQVRGTSRMSVEDAIKRGIAGVNRTLESVRCLWMREQRVTHCEDHVSEYSVDMLVTFFGDDYWRPDLAPSPARPGAARPREQF
jgi:flavin-binding protein dodecin